MGCKITVILEINDDILAISSSSTYIWP